MTSWNRRHFIKSASGLFSLTSITGAMQRMMAGIMMDQKYQAQQGAEVSEAARNFLQINLYGGPSRLGFDHLLKPFDENDFLPYKFVANKIKSQNPDKPEEIEFTYATEKIQGLNLPLQWKQSIPSSDGKFRPMTDLLQNMLMIRGCRLDFSGHPLNAMQQICPIQGGLSLNGVLGDRSDALFSAVSLGSNPVSRAFKSESCQLTEIPYQNENYLAYMMNPFLVDQIDRINKAGALEAEFDKVFAGYPDEFKKIIPLKQKVLRNMTSSLDSYMANYSKLISKYRGLIRRSVASVDLGTPIRGPNLPIVVGDSIKSTKDVLGPFCMGLNVCFDQDISAVVRSGHIDHWAEEFALAEFLLTEGICKNVLLNAPSPDIGKLLNRCSATKMAKLQSLEIRNEGSNRVIDFIKSDNRNNSFFAASKDEHIPMDTHIHGLIFEILSNDIFFRAISSCLLELIEVLRKKQENGKSLFDETVIQLASEFDRYPLTDGSGSDHNAYANPTSVFSGCIKGPMVIGNIYTGTLEPQGELIYGTIGVGAPVKELERSIAIGHVSSSLSDLLRIPRIVKRNQPIIQERQGQVVSLIEKAKNVEGAK